MHWPLEQALQRGLVLEHLPLFRLRRMDREREVMRRVGADRMTRPIRECEDLVVRQDPVGDPW
jgi:hypothetical protein